MRAFNTERGGNQVLALVGFIGLCLLAGAVGGRLTAQSVLGWYATLARPPGTPPNWLFGPVWTALYILMGTAAWLVWRRPAGGQRAALQWWGWQLLVGALWTPAFFVLHSPAAGMVVLIALLALVGRTIAAFARQDRLAAGLLVPYAVWSCYATYLNAGFLWLNIG